MSEAITTRRRRIRLTREGLIFIIIFLFITIGAVMRNVNLLIILSGMMIAPLILGWRICAQMLSELEFKRNVPLWVHARQKFDVEWQCTNERDRLPTWGLVIKDHLRENPKESLKKCTSVEALLAQVKPGETSYTTYRCLFPQRGVYRIGPAKISTRFPMGLVVGTLIEADTELELCVAPALGHLTPTWERRMQSDACGSLATRRRRGAEEDEFYALRAFRSGDSSRQIHWRSTAKFGEPIIKQYDQKSDRDFALAIDLFAPSLDETSANLPEHHEKERIEKILSFSATVFAKLRKAIQGRVAVAICGEEPFILSDKNNRELISIIMQKLATAKAAAETQLGDGIRELYSQVSTGTPVFVISSRPQPESFEGLIKTNSPSTLHTIEKWTRWIEVETDEFNELFKTSHEMNEQETHRA